MPRSLVARPPLPAGPFLVVGMARSGVAAALALSRAGHTVSGVDRGIVPDDVRAELRAAGVALHEDTDGVALLDGCRTLVKSPGVPREAPVVAAALAQGIDVLGELELAWRMLPNPVVAVTGSNGKTTTVELLGHIHREAGIPATVAGNVGTPLSAHVGELAPDRVLIVEASSFQLEDTVAFAPDAAALLNVTPDHLDRHGTFDAYRRAKLQIFAHQPDGAVAVAPEGFEVEDLGGCARRIGFGESARAEMGLRQGRLWWDGTPFIDAAEVGVPGRHNLDNAMVAAALCLARGMDVDAVRQGLRTFPGVPHRLERVAEIDDVAWVNDSKATNVASAAVGIRSVASPVHLILGGRDKAQDFTPLLAPVLERCASVLLIGEAAETIAAALRSAADRVRVEHVGTLASAVDRAGELARPGETVLLSPACASFDQFRSYEDRGERFAQLVRARTG